ncbi:thioredoxin family protein [Priestia megaterium]|uniref:thioredoxin family protein n=1 Tax=Priestia megaterium TaxID=1404 RepID=UPI0030007140
MKLLKIEQTNCTPCKMLGNFLKNELGVEVDEVVNISEGTITTTATGHVEKDEDLAMELAGQFSIMKTPTLVLVDEDGEEIKKFSGVGQTGVREILSMRGLI